MGNYQVPEYKPKYDPKKNNKRLPIILLGVAVFLAVAGFLSSKDEIEKEQTTSVLSEATVSSEESAIESKSSAASSKTSSVASSESSRSENSSVSSSRQESSISASTAEPSSRPESPASTSKPVEPAVDTTPETSVPPSSTASSVPPSAPVEPTTEQVETTSNTVFWTPNGKSYHSTSGCRSLARSKTILSGTLEEAIAAGKSDPCNNCVK